MAVLDDKTRSQLKSVLGNMVNPVKVVLFTQEFECPLCKDTKEFVEEICSLSDKIDFQLKGFVDDSAYAEKLGVDKNPAVVILDNDGKDYGIKFYGPPGGYEINSFLKSILEVSGKREEFSQDLIKRIKAVDKDIHIQVFVSTSCPHCPEAVSKSHRLAFENDRIKTDMIEGSAFPHIVNKFNVTSVPKIVINNNTEILGNVPVEDILKAIESL
jgi:glutaredoxin-like protein